MKFRTKHLPQIGYFAQVKSGWFGGWETIGKHPCGFGLYSEDHKKYPLKSENEAIDRCRLYENYKDLGRGIATYTDV